MGTPNRIICMRFLMTRSLVRTGTNDQISTALCHAGTRMCGRGQRWRPCARSPARTPLGIFASGARGGGQRVRESTGVTELSPGGAQRREPESQAKQCCSQELHRVLPWGRCPLRPLVGAGSPTLYFPWPIPGVTKETQRKQQNTQKQNERESSEGPLSFSTSSIVGAPRVNAPSLRYRPLCGTFHCVTNGRQLTGNGRPLGAKGRRVFRAF